VSTDDPWWQAAFTADYLDVYAHRDDAQAADDVAGLLAKLRAVGGPILDAGCGNGRHLEHLRRNGLNAFGCDLSCDLLRAAATRARVSGALMRADLRQPPVASGWGAVLLLFTAFGYFDDAGNGAFLGTLGALVRRGGLLLLDLPDRQYLADHLVASSSRSTPRGLRVDEERHLVGNRVEKVVALHEGERLLKTYRESVRLYDRDEIAAMACEHGLRVGDIWPGLHGPGVEQHRLVMWLERVR
jgi:SAM-dependent methyltransferase